MPDVSAALAQVEMERTYLRPEVDTRCLRDRGGRHPVGEQALGGRANLHPMGTAIPPAPSFTPRKAREDGRERPFAGEVR